MKKILVLAFALLLCMSLSVTAFAGEYTVGENGIAVYDTAIGYVFDIRAIDDKITGEDAVIMTKNENTGKTGVWSTWTIAEEIDDTGVYRAIKSVEAMSGELPDVTLDPGQIYIVVHSSTSKPEEAAKEGWDNWEDKVAFMAVKGGDCFVFKGIDFEKGTCVDGKMMCLTEEDALNGNYSWGEETEESTPETNTESEAVSEAESQAESVSDNASAEGETESKTDSAEIKTEIIDDSDVTSSDIEIDGDGEGLGVCLWVIIGAAVVVVFIVVVMLAKKK